jgi:hypothetical protein
LATFENALVSRRSDSNTHRGWCNFFRSRPELLFFLAANSVLFRDGRRVPPDQELRIALPLSRFDNSWFSDSEFHLTASKTVKPVTQREVSRRRSRDF